MQEDLEIDINADTNTGSDGNNVQVPEKSNPLVEFGDSTNQVSNETSEDKGDNGSGKGDDMIEDID